MRKVLAAVIMLVGIVLAGYVGIGIMFVGGVEQIVDSVQAEPADGGGIAWGVLRVLFAGTATVITLLFFGFLSFLTAGTDLRDRW